MRAGVPDQPGRLRRADVAGWRGHHAVLHDHWQHVRQQRRPLAAGRSVRLDHAGERTRGGRSHHAHGATSREHAGMMRGGGRHGVLRAFYWSVVVWLFLPLALIVLMSTADSPTVGFPVERLTVRWYGEVLADRDVIRAFFYSCAAAGGSTALALAVGLW